MAYSIGQRVKVVDDGKCYTTYYDWIAENGISFRDNGKIRSLWAKYLTTEDNSCENGEELTIVAIGCHGNDRCITMYLCEDGHGNPVLINELGLNPIKEGLKWFDLEVGDVIRKKVITHGSGYRVAMITVIDTFDTGSHVLVGNTWLTDDELADGWEKVDA